MGKLNDFHEKNWQRMHEAFAPAHGLGPLLACVGEEIGELFAAILGVTGEKKRKAHLTSEQVLDACADAATYLSLTLYRLGFRDLERALTDARGGDVGPAHDVFYSASRVQENMGGLCFSSRVGGYEAAANYAARCYIELVSIARSHGCGDWQKLLGDTFNMVSDRCGSKLKTELGQ